jgi:hypothetical protein
MRDIRPDLRQRLRCIARERGKMHQRLRELEASQRNIEALLAHEEAKSKDGQQLTLFNNLPEHRVERARALRELIVQTLSDGRETSLSDLMRLAHERGILDPHASARILNMTLINLYRCGCAERLPTGLWRAIRRPDAQSLVSNYTQ